MNRNRLTGSRSLFTKQATAFQDLPLLLEQQHTRRRSSRSSSPLITDQAIATASAETPAGRVYGTSASLAWTESLSAGPDSPALSCPRTRGVHLDDRVFVLVAGPRAASCRKSAAGEPLFSREVEVGLRSIPRAGWARRPTRGRGVPSLDHAVQSPGLPPRRGSALAQRVHALDQPAR
jgi:hypothetical protein